MVDDMKRVVGTEDVRLGGSVIIGNVLLMKHVYCVCNVHTYIFFQCTGKNICMHIAYTALQCIFFLNRMLTKVHIYLIV